MLVAITASSSDSPSSPRHRRPPQIFSLDRGIGFRCTTLEGRSGGRAYPSLAMSHVVLAGMPGSGKSAVGRRLAEHRGWRHVDTDMHIEAQAGRSIADIFATDGEESFRALEAATLVEVLANPAPTVISLGGGAVLCADTRELLSEHCVFWLRATIDTLARRVGSGARRPLLANDTEPRLAELAEQRSALYAEVATRIVDVDEIDVDEIVELLA